eukprot:2908284-Rhodomonas_salina.1
MQNLLHDLLTRSHCRTRRLSTDEVQKLASGEGGYSLERIPVTPYHSNGLQVEALSFVGSWSSFSLGCFSIAFAHNPVCVSGGERFLRISNQHSGTPLSHQLPHPLPPVKNINPSVKTPVLRCRETFVNTHRKFAGFPCSVSKIVPACHSDGRGRYLDLIRSGVEARALEP